MARKGNHKWGIFFLIYVAFLGAEKEERTVLQIEPSLASHNKYNKEFMKRQKDRKILGYKSNS